MTKSGPTIGASMETTSRNANKADKAKRWAEQELVNADAWASKKLPKAQKQARRMRRVAKRFRAKAERRAGKIQCEDIDY